MSYFYFQSKKIYYAETGNGKPALFLHGNTASSRMFEPILPLYTKDFRVICMDFLGYGKSDRLEKFPPDIWREEAGQVIALLEHLQLEKAHLVGTSGGAWVAINAALERADLVDKVVADSFDGRTLGADFSENLLRERENAKKDRMARGFYQWCQGEDWERVVDLDTEALVRCAAERLPLFVKPLCRLQAPLLLMGSEKDEMLRRDFQQEYRAIAAETGAAITLFSAGSHPAILSSAEQAAEAIFRFLK